MISIAQERGAVPFPQVGLERVYMQPFFKKEGLPKQYQHWQPTIDAMLEGVDTEAPIYLMVDRGHVKAGTPHRRPGVHIDGYWNPGKSEHGHNGVSAHGSGGGHRGNGHRSTPQDDRHGGSKHMAGGWVGATYEAHEGILLASDIQACRAFIGEYREPPKDGGDCSHVDTSSLIVVPFEAGKVYAGNVTMLHESLPVQQDCVRTVVRLNVPHWSPTLH